MADKNTSRKKKAKLNFTKGVAHIHASFNNTIISITDVEGKVIAWDSAGTIGYSGAKKSTPSAAGLIRILLDDICPEKRFITIFCCLSLLSKPLRQILRGTAADKYRTDKHHTDGV